LDALDQARFCFVAQKSLGVAMQDNVRRLEAIRAVFLAKIEPEGA